MARPSLTASNEGIVKAEQALTKIGKMKKDLRQTIGCSRQPITNFFAGKSVEQELFISICRELGLNWQEIAGLSTENRIETDQSGDRHNNDFDSLVQKVKEKVRARIEQQCGTMRVLDMSHPIGINDIYTSVNVLEKIAGRTYKSISQLIDEFHLKDLEDFERFGLGRVVEERVPGLEAVEKHHKLIILGKPGAGKTTFLKYLAIQCINEQFKADLVPIFVTLKNFAEAHDHLELLQYISRGNLVNYVPTISEEVEEENYQDFYQIVSQGKALVLLDGLDEVRKEDSDRVLKEIRDFSLQFHQNHFVMTCRIAAWEYIFEKFTEVEIADFDDLQIASFAHNWFQNTHVTSQDFLNCLHSNYRLKELATTPLFLTLLCLVFAESGSLPLNRSELYEEGISILLKKWDDERRIDRDNLYKNLSSQLKANLLSQIALKTFKIHYYFLKDSLVQDYIAEYLNQISGHKTDLILQQDSEAILASIEAQHGLLIERAKGIYSFSHLTFHEYFAAREIVNSPQQSQELQELLTHITDRRWREIFLLVTEMLRDATSFIVTMKQKVDRVLANNSHLQDYLEAVKKQADYSFYNSAEVRAFFLDPDFELDEHRTLAVGINREANILVCASFFRRVLENIELKKAIKIAQDYDQKFNQKITRAASADQAMIIAIEIALNSERLKKQVQPELQKIFQQYKNQEIDLVETAIKARVVAKTSEHIQNHLSLVACWNFSENEKALLKDYYYANTLLVKCLNQDCLIKPEIKNKIKETLLLPASQVQNESSLLS